MTRLTSLDLTPFYRNAVGFDSLFDRMTANIDMAASSGGQNYPPYDIIRTGDETYRIQIAVAGFQLADIKIELENGTLNITSSVSSVSTCYRCNYTVVTPLRTCFFVRFN